MDNVNAQIHIPGMEQTESSRKSRRWEQRAEQMFNKRKLYLLIVSSSL